MNKYYRKSVALLSYIEKCNTTYNVNIYLCAQRKELMFITIVANNKLQVQIH